MASDHLARAYPAPEHRALRQLVRDQHAAKRPLFRARDFVIVAAIGCGAALFGALPRPACIKLARAMARVRAALFAGELTAAQLARLTGIDTHAANAVLRSHSQERRIASALFLRSLIRGPAYQIDLHGADAIDSALARGNGVVLWVSDLVYAQDVAKIALSQSGYRASHLSQPEHGFSDSVFGIRVLNPIRTRFESRYLQERIVCQRGQPGQAVQQLLQRLGSNGIVSITATSAEGRKLYEAEFLRGRLRLAPGAPKIGYRSGAPVLPVFAVPHPEAPSFRVLVESPLKMDGAGEEAAIATAVQDYVSRLERYVRQWPHLWAGWDACQLGDQHQPAPCPAPAIAASST